MQEVTPFVVHATFQFGGVRGKQTRLREAMLWRDSPAYRTEPRLLSIQLHQLHLAPAELDALTDEQMIAVTGVWTGTFSAHHWPAALLASAILAASTLTVPAEVLNH